MTPFPAVGEGGLTKMKREKTMEKGTPLRGPVGRSSGKARPCERVCACPGSYSLFSLCLLVLFIKNSLPPSLSP